MAKRIFKHAGNTLLYGFAGVTVVLLIVFALGIRPYITISGSMEPTIQTGSICFINTNNKYEDARVGDIIAFEAGNTLVTHRVLEITEKGMRTKGDNNEDPDKMITTCDNFVGQNLFSIPHVGYIVLFFQKPIGLGIIAFCAVVALLFTSKDMLKPRKKIPKTDKE